jgi:hypothetical protein
MKILLQAPCGFDRLEMAPLFLANSGYAESIGATYVLAIDRAPRTMPVGWNQMYAIQGELGRREDGDLVYWLAPDSRVVTEEDIFTQPLAPDGGFVACSTWNGRPHPRAVMLRVCEESKALLRTVLYSVRHDRSPVDVFSAAVHGIKNWLEIPPEFVGSPAHWAVNPLLPEPKVVAAPHLDATATVHALMSDELPAYLGRLREQREIAASPVTGSIATASDDEPRVLAARTPVKPAVAKPAVRVRRYGPGTSNG